jgi:hypothetical protein
MKRTSYYFILIIAAGLFFSTSGYGLEEQSKEKVKGTEQQAPEKNNVNKSEQRTNTESVWLNSKNFPLYQEGQCPFYLLKPGC